jgi:hypothetical protein
MIIRKSTLKALVKQYARENKRSYIVKQLDKIVSDITKEREGGRCERCGKIRKNMGVSHYFSRRYIGTRWESANLCWLCWLPCHNLWEHDKQGEYTDHMLETVGRERVELLKMKAYGINKWSTSDLKVLLYDYEKNKSIPSKKGL